jgi:hypothetical protein
MGTFILMAVIGVFPIIRLWWVYRIKSLALASTSQAAKRLLNEGKDYSLAYRKYDRQSMPLMAMFFNLHKWSVKSFYSM